MALLGMDILPDYPGSLLEFRDTLLTADLMLTNGANEWEMWQVFARRGWGYSASFSNDVAYEAFDLPPGLVPEPSTLALLGVAAIGLLGYAWRRRKAA
jgi:hypothetical protein